MKPSLFGMAATERRVFFAAFVMFSFLSGEYCAAIAQSLNTDRAYEHVTVAPIHLAEFSSDIAPVAELFLFTYRLGIWQQIPFQIDERGLEINVDGDTSLNSFFPNEKDGELDDSDEVIFMAQDAGVRAAANNWITDASARSFPRYEITVTDPRTLGQGYVYLYRSRTLTASPALATYVRYTPGPAANPAADTVRGVSYVQGHTSNGIPDYLIVPPSFGGNGVDFLDRLKLRIQVEVPLFGARTINERDNLVAVAGGIRTLEGRIRVIRQVRERIQIDLFGAQIPVDTLAISLFFYPYAAQLTGEINLTQTLSARLMRASLDFEPNVSNQAWHNQNAGPRIITGASGALTDDEARIAFLPQRNWFSMGSIHGSLTGVFEMEPLANTVQKFYFRDAQSGTSDGTTDTGDNRSYGDTGFMITSTSAIIAQFQLGMSAFYLKPGLTREEAANLSANAETPVQVNTSSQEYDAIAPATVHDLSVGLTTDTSAVLLLTAPADVGSFVKNYEVAYSTTPVGNDTAAWFRDAQKAANLSPPAQPETYQVLPIAGLTRGARYCFILRSIDDFGNASAFSNVACGTIVAVTEPKIAAQTPSRFMLAQNHPNPFSATQSGTLIRYELPNAQAIPVVLRVYDLLGHEVRRIVQTKQTRGLYAVQWDGRNENGALLPAGVYFYELRAGDLRQVQKLVLVR